MFSLKKFSFKIQFSNSIQLTVMTLQIYQRNLK